MRMPRVALPRLEAADAIRFVVWLFGDITFPPRKLCLCSNAVASETVRINPQPDSCISEDAVPSSNRNLTKTKAARTVEANLFLDLRGCLETCKKTP